MKYVEKFARDIREAMDYKRISEEDREILDKMKNKYLDLFVDSLMEE